MSLSLGFRFDVTCRCLVCGWQIDRWGDRLKGARRLAKTSVDGGTEYDLEVGKPCPMCLGRRVRLRVTVGKTRPPSPR